MHVIAVRNAVLCSLIRYTFDKSAGHVTSKFLRLRSLKNETLASNSLPQNIRQFSHPRLGLQLCLKFFLVFFYSLFSFFFFSSKLRILYLSSSVLELDIIH